MLWAESTPIVIGMDSTLSAHVPLAHVLIYHILRNRDILFTLSMARLLLQVQHLACLNTYEVYLMIKLYYILYWLLDKLLVFATVLARYDTYRAPYLYYTYKPIYTK